MTQQPSSSKVREYRTCSQTLASSRMAGIRAMFILCGTGMVLSGGFQIDHLDHLVLTVRNLTSSLDFYTHVMGMRQSRWGGPNAVHFGRSKINIYQVGNALFPNPSTPTPGSADLCFITTTDVDDVIDHLKEHDVRILRGPVWRPGAMGGITSVYFRDPDGNLIEVSNYP